jgi:sugar phosphate isomerase/epimerase
MSRISRRSFLKGSVASGLSFGIRTDRRTFHTAQSPGSLFSGIGICASLADAGALEKAGCDYIEETVRRHMVPDGPDSAFVARLAEIKASPLPIPVCNSFLPGTLKAVGPAADHAGILAYAGAALRRAAKCGVRTIVWGSGDSRRVPEGFSKSRAEEQFRDLAARVALLAASSEVALVIEPLNPGETNFINSLREGAEIVEAVGSPSLRLLADIYHMLRADETPAAIERYGALLRHCHIAEKDKRTPPGTAGDDFRPYFRALRKAGYGGRLSIECGWEDMGRQAGPSVAALRRQIEESA